MATKLSDKIVKELPAPVTGNKIHYDTEVTGFGVRLTAAGARSFILNYRTKLGRERRYTIGKFPDWTVAAARAYAKELGKQIDQGQDPLAEIQAGRKAPTVADLCARFIEEHLPKKRPGTQRHYRSIINNYILPDLKNLKVAEVTFSDIDGLHRKLTRRGVLTHANRAVALLSVMFGLAIRWKMRTDNPAKGIERNQETKRQRYLSGDELARLTGALADHSDTQAANIIRMLLLTGARTGEVLSAQWDQFDLEDGIWVKPGATTKQKTEHRVPLSAPARQLLVELKSTAESEFVFPGLGGEHRTRPRKAWAELCRAAGISGVHVHDLRHTYASVLVSSGLSLPVIGALLGHTQPATTARYAHLQDDPLRKATETAGAIITGRPSAEVQKLRG
jgi:integrase